MTRRTFSLSLGSMALASLVGRLGYGLWQASHDPTFSRPMLDGAVYLNWARGLAGGLGEPAGAFYLAPLYPHLLAAFLLVFGEAPRLLNALQQVMLIGAGCLLALRFSRSIGEPAALFAASAVFLYHPTVFFASRPIGEPVALFLLALGIYLLGRPAPVELVLSGVAFGLATLARPNFLLVVLSLAAVELVGRNWKRFVLLAAAFGVTLAPVAFRNYLASGHPVFVSSNGGLTLYHGNGPGALGIYNPPLGFSGTLVHQREEATRLARARSGRALDAVDADRWWGREAIRTRLGDPLGSAELLARRMLLVVDNYEHSLDDAPALDGNPWRLAFPAPFALVLGLATVGAVAVGLAGSGGVAAWAPILATAAMPLVFYVSSRYRLPMAFLLCVPAGAGAAAILGRGPTTPSRRRLTTAMALGALMAIGSLVVPSSALARAEEAAAHANRAWSFAEVGELRRAEAEARTALTLDPSSVLARYNLAVVLGAAGRRADAETLYREALTLDPSHAESAGNLAKILVERGAAGEAVPILTRALATRPGDAACWTNLIVAWVSLGDLARARGAVADAEAAGVELAPELLEAAGAGSNPGNSRGESGR